MLCPQVSRMGQWWRVGAVAAVFVSSLWWLWFLASRAPLPSATSASSPSRLQFPSDLAELRELSALASQLSAESPTYALLLFASAYLFKQTFAIPGSVFLNVLGGAVFGLPLGVALCTLLTGVGASCCFLLARFCGAEVAEAMFPDRVAAFRRRLKENEGRLLYFLLALRLFPASPNWAINMSCGVLRVPLSKFFLTVLLGLLPYNYLCVQAGAVLASVDSLADIFSWPVMLQMAAMAAVASLPGLWAKARGEGKKSN